MTIDGPGTIDALVADAEAVGHKVSPRLVRDWTAHGLLDYPQRRPAGRGRGSLDALYPANQRKLFLSLLGHRPTNKIRSLCRIPIFIWMYWGDDYVPTRQTRTALRTWVGDARVSLAKARQTANEILRQLDNDAATATARDELKKVVASLAYTARPDIPRLQNAIRAVFEPSLNGLHRTVGHPGAPLTAQSMVDLVVARLAAVNRIAADDFADEELQRARQVHLTAYAEYALHQPTYAAGTLGQAVGMYEPPNAEVAANNVCGHLLTALGLATLHPNRTVDILAGRSDVHP